MSHAIYMLSELRRQNKSTLEGLTVRLSLGTGETIVGKIESFNTGVLAMRCKLSAADGRTDIERQVLVDSDYVATITLLDKNDADS